MTKTGHVNIGLVAKNLLAGRSCNNCIYCINNDFEEGSICNKDCYTLPGKLIPKENTCLEWKESFPIEIKVTSMPIAAKPKKLKIKWTKDGQK